MPTREENLRTKLAAAAQPHLASDEKIEQVFWGVTKYPWLPLIGALTCGWLSLYYVATNRYRIVAVTDRRFVVLDAGRLSVRKAKSVARELPRSTKIDTPPETLWFKTTSLGETLYVHKRFYPDIAAIDLGSGTAKTDAVQPPAIQGGPDRS